MMHSEERVSPLCPPHPPHVCLTIPTICVCLSLQLCPCQHFVSLFIWITFNICPLMIGRGYPPLLGASFTNLSGAELALWLASILMVLALPTPALPSQHSGLLPSPSLVATIVTVAGISSPWSLSYKMRRPGACKQKSLSLTSHLYTSQHRITWLMEGSRAALNFSFSMEFAVGRTWVLRRGTFHRD